MAVEGCVVITGASGGIGEALTFALAGKGYPIVMACRNLAKARLVQQRVVARTGNSRVELRELDLSSLASVRRFTQSLQAQAMPVSVLLNNAGVMNGTFRLTGDGLEEDMAVNYVGTVALTIGLLPLMPRGARIVNTVSCTYRLGRIGTDFLKPDAGKFGRFTTYGNSKLALLLFTLELSGRLKSRGIGVNAADPGIVDTGMLTMGRWFDPLADILFRPWVKTPQQGASTALFLACSPDAEGVTGGLWRGRRRCRLSRNVCEHPLRQSILQQTEEWIGAR